MGVRVSYASENGSRIGQAWAESPVLQLHAIEDIEIEPLGRALIHTGVRLALPPYHAGLAVPARAMAVGRGLMFANSPGLIDTGYRGEVCGIAFNPSDSKAIAVEKGEHFMDLLVTRTINGGEPSPGKERDMDSSVLALTMFDEGAEPPAYAHEDDNGLDLRSSEDIEIGPLEHRSVRLGVGISLPAGYLAQIQPRSGLSLKKGLSVMGSPVIVDPAEYGRELEVELINLDAREPFVISRGERVVQLVITRMIQVKVELEGALGETERGGGGFGSSGVV